jgi:outer membrane protein assembly factor BamB
MANVTVTPTVRWKLETDGGLFSSPTVVSGTAYVGSADGTLYAVETATGDREWTFSTGDRVRSSPAVADGTVYVGSRDANLYAVDASRGDQQWVVETDWHLYSSPTVVDKTVYVGSWDSLLYAVDGTTGDQQWICQTDWHIYASPTVADGTVYVGSHDSHLYAVDATTGDRRWSFRTGEYIDSSPTVSNGTVYVGCRGGTLYAVDALTGDREWMFNAGDLIFSSPTVADGLIYVGSRDSNLYAVDAATGKQEWMFETGHGVRSSPTAADGTIYVGSRDSNLYAVDASTGDRRWAFETDGEVNSSPTVVDGTVYVGSRDNCLYAIETETAGSSDGSRVMLGTLGHHDGLVSAQMGHPSASFAIAIEETTAPVEPGDELDVTVSVENADERAVTETVTVTANGIGSAEQTVTLDGSASTTEQLTIETDGADSDTYSLRASTESGDTDTQSIVVRSPSTFEISVLDIEEPETAGEEITVTAVVTNTGDERDTRSITIGGADLQTRTLDRALESGESETILTHIPTTATDSGQHTVEVDTSDDTATASVTLPESGTDDADATGDDAGSVEAADSDTASARQTTRSVPDRIPTIGSHSLSYDAIEAVEEIGHGGNADVYLATATIGASEVELAVKEPRMSGTLHTETVERMLDEAETWQQLDDHDHIVSVVDYGAEPLPWIGMEYMDAGHLGERADEMGFDQKLWTAIAVTRAVRHAHTRGVAHLDLKPANVLFRSVDDAWDAPKVADWGLSKHLLNHSKSMEGITPDYAAPEQFDSDVFGGTDHVTDVYQLGAVLYELFTGRPPFEGSPVQVMNSVINDRPTPPSDHADLPESLDEILLTALATERDDRYESVLYLRDELQSLADDL